MLDVQPMASGLDPAKWWQAQTVSRNRKGYTALPRAIYKLFGIEHYCRGIDNSLAVRLRHMRSPKRIRKADPESDLSFPPPFQQQAKYLSLADQFLAHSNGRQPGQKIQPLDSSERFRRAKKKAA